MMNEKSIVFTTAKTQRASEVIYEQIYQYISSGELQSGDRLPSERELAEQFGRSRPSVREALRMLQQDGLLTISVGTNGGAVVQGMSLSNAEQPLTKLIESGAISLQELVDYRAYNDRCCAELAAKYHTQEDVKNLHSIMERYKKSIPDSEAVAKIDVEFHKALARASHNKMCILITDVVTSLCTNLFWGVAARDMEPQQVIEVNRNAYETHQRIVDSLTAGDSSAMAHNMDEAIALFYRAVTPGYIK